MRYNETFDTKAECEEWLNHVVVPRSGNKKEQKLPKASYTKAQWQGSRNAMPHLPPKASRIPNSAISYSGGIDELQRHLDMMFLGKGSFIPKKVSIPCCIVFWRAVPLLIYV